MDLWIFWAVAGALTAMVALIFVQALRRGGADQTDHPDVKVYRDQLAEVDRDLARGTLAPEEAKRLRVEVSRRLLEADRARQAATAPKARGSLIWAGVLVLAALTGSLWLYDRIGAPGYPDLPLSVRLQIADEAYKTRPSQATAEAATPAPPSPQPGAEFLSLMEKLRAAVADRPDDVTGLELLARNETALGNFAAAQTAQAHLLDILGEAATPDQRLMPAQIMIAATGGYVSPEAEAHLIDVLNRDPRHPMARYLSGLMFAQVGRPDRAFQLWQPLLTESPPDAPYMAALRDDIQTVADQAGVKFSLPSDMGPSAGPSAGDMAAAGEMTPEDRQAMIAGMVGQLETRLFSEGGTVDEWLKLMNALGVLNQPDRGKAALKAAEAALAADPTGLKAVRDAATAAGFGP